MPAVTGCTFPCFNTPGSHAQTFVRGRQEDAHELLLALLDAVERDCKRVLAVQMRVGLAAVKVCVWVWVWCGVVWRCSVLQAHIGLHALKLQRCSAVQCSATQHACMSCGAA